MKNVLERIEFLRRGVDCGESVIVVTYQSRHRSNLKSYLINSNLN